MNKLKVLYLNVTADTSHVGCLAVTYAHVKMFFLRGLEISSYSLSSLKQYWKGNRPASLIFIENSLLAADILMADFIVINGEGTIHHNRGLHLLAIAEFAQLCNKPVFLINSTIQKINGFDDIFLNMNDIVVRDSNSYHYLNQKGIPCRLCMDDFINADFNLASSIDYKDKVITTDWHPHVESAVLPIIQKIKGLKPAFAPLSYAHAFNDWQNVVENYKTASLIIAGRYHSIYAAGLAEKPFIVLPTNSYKAIGLIKFSKLPIPYCSKSSHILNQIKYAQNNLSLYKEFKDFLHHEHKDTSFKAIDKFIGPYKQNINNKLASKRALNFLEVFKFKAIEQFNSIIFNTAIKTSEDRINTNQKLIINHKYEEWLNKYKTVFIETPTYLINIIESYFAIGNFQKSEIFIEKLNKINKKLGTKYLSLIYIETGRSDLLSNIIDYNEKWNTERYLFFLDTKLYHKAWEMCTERNSSQIYFRLKKHFYDTNKFSDICIILEGGIGDQIRHTILFNEIRKKFTNISIACDNRLHTLLKSNFNEFNFINLSNVEEYDNICPILDLYKIIPPENLLKNSYLYSNKLLNEYWSNYLKKLAKGKRIIGICQGTHIHTYNRLSNIFDYILWDKLFSKHSKTSLFVNLSFDYSKDTKDIVNLPINLHDDFENIAAVIHNCDFVITPANTILDLCGALNKKVFALYTGFKFRYRIKTNQKDLFHKNTYWIGTKECFNKQEVLENINSKIL